jgi:catechol 2,3-dioxygenase-like lactoylglutathione lyase family enzyme
VATLGSIMPALPVRNLDAALDFYRDKLGFTVRHREDGGGAIVVRDAVELHLTQLNDESWKVRPDFFDRPVKSGAESFLPGTASLRIQVDDVRELYAQCASKGILHPKGSLRESRGVTPTSGSSMSTAISLRSFSAALAAIGHDGRLLVRRTGKGGKRGRWGCVK